MLKILFISDIVGSPGRNAVCDSLPGLKNDYNIDFVIVNGENAAAGAGITSKITEELFGYGVDVITTGDHIWDKKDVQNVIDNSYFLRPINLSINSRGKGVCLKESGKSKIGVVNVLGRVFMKILADNPFNAIKKAVDELKKKTNIIIVDFHAETTSEKKAMGWFLDGQVTAVLGTHTHVQTADEIVLPKGTAYITDVGMTGACDSVIGRKKEAVIEAFLTGMPVRFELANSDVQLQGVVISINKDTGSAVSIERVFKKIDE